MQNLRVGEYYLTPLYKKLNGMWSPRYTIAVCSEYRGNNNDLINRGLTSAYKHAQSGFKSGDVAWLMIDFERKPFNEHELVTSVWHEVLRSKEFPEYAIEQYKTPLSDYIGATSCKWETALSLEEAYGDLVNQWAERPDIAKCEYQPHAQYLLTQEEFIRQQGIRFIAPYLGLENRKQTDIKVAA